MSSRARAPRLCRAAIAALLGVLFTAAPRLLAAGSTSIAMASDAGDWIGGGRTYLLTPQDGAFSVTRSATNGAVNVFFNGPTWWNLTFAPPTSQQPLAPGMFEAATRYPFQSPTRPGLDVSGDGRGCGTMTGRFVVLEAQFAPNGDVTSFAADFEQHCEGAAAALLGSVRFNSSAVSGPRLSVSSTSAYEGDGEAKSLSFVVSLSARSVAAVSVDYATADGTAKAGTDYVATSGTAYIPAGQTSAAFDVPILGNTQIQPDRQLVVSLSNAAGAPVAFGQGTGTILDDDTGKTFVEFASDPNDYIGRGRTFTLTPLDGTMTPARVGDGVGIYFQGSPSWYFEFWPRTGSPLVPGVYELAQRGASPVRPGLDVFGDGRGCGSNTGRFTVLEARYSPAGEVQALAIDYEQHCEGSAPALFGSVRFNSLVATGPRLSVAPSAVYEGDGETNFLAFRMSLSRRVASDVSASFATSDGTAAAGTDYAAAAGSVTIPAGETAARVNVGVLGNKVVQPDRAMVFSLSNAAGAPLGFGTASGTILDDDGPRDVVRLDSEAGDYIGVGSHLTLRPPLDGVLTTTGGPSDLDVLFTGLKWWEFHFTPPQGHTLTVGAYEGATRWPTQAPTAPGLSVSGDGRGCNALTGRFDVLQADFGPSGQVLALAIDFEQHCEGMVPALFGSIRINSAIPFVKRPAPPTLSIAFGAAEMPVGGTTSLTFRVANPNPQDVLTGVGVTDALPAGLVVATPSGLAGACGGGTLTADAGTGAVSLAGATLPMGDSCTFSVNVTGIAAGFKNDRATPTSAESGPGKPAGAGLKVGLPPPFLTFASDPGDWIGLGQTFTLTPADGTITVTGGANETTVLFSPTSGVSYWYLEFAPPSPGPLAPGIYEVAGPPTSRAPGTPGLSVSGNGHGCNTITGRFVVLEAQYAIEGDLQALAIDYEQHCDGGGPALFGSVRYNSILGTGPRLSVASATTYEGDGPPKNLTLRISLSARAAVPVSVDYATADDSAKAGTDYVATSGTATFAAGQTVALVDVPLLGNTVPQPDRGFKVALGNAAVAPIAFGEATGTILDDDFARTFLDLASDPGDWAGGGQSFFLTPLDGTFTASSSPGHVSVVVHGAGYWFLDFAAPSGTAFVPGVYEGAVRYPFQGSTAPGLSVAGGCNTLTGRFVVLEAVIGPSGDVQKLAIDFEQHCEGAVPALLGSIRYNSLLSAVPRVSVAPAAAYEGDGQPKSLPFRLSLSRRSATTVSVDYATADGSAKAGTDFTATSGTATFAPGQTSARVDVPILGNRIVQPDRSLTLSLANATGAPLAFGQAPGVIRDDDAGRTLLILTSDPGDWVGSGLTRTFTPLDGGFLAGGSPLGQVSVQFTGTNYWTLDFSPPIGGLLAPGAFENAARFPASSPPTPGLDVYGEGHGCNVVKGRFVVYEARFGGVGEVQALAIDFEQHCEGLTPALRGYLRYNSAVPVVLPAVASTFALLPPCRVVDTRLAGGPLQPAAERTFATAGTCGIPPTATALVANVTITNPTQPGSLTTYRADGARPLATSISFPAGRTRANNALLGVSSDGTASIKVFLDSLGTADFILDVSGYFQ